MPTRLPTAKVRSRAFLAVTIGAVVLISAAPVRATTAGQNGRIAYSRERPKVALLLTIRPDGSHQRLLAKHYHVRWPDWSPDGEWVAYCAQARHSGSDIYVVRSDGTGRHRLTDFAGYDCKPAWSPDGEWVAFDRVVDGAKRVLAIHPDGTGLHLLVGNAEDAQFSPDGEWIAFTRVKNDHQAVFVRRVDGGLARRITPLSIRGVQPDWSPSGARIAFLSPEYHFGLPNVFAVNPDGSNLLQVTHIRRAAWGVLDVSWSPNGRRMVIDLDFDAYTIRAGGGHRHRIADVNLPLSSPDWGPRPTS
jgi:Tol biopolymer transport system component